MKKRILFIDDDQFLSELLTHRLETEGYEVSIVRDGDEGLKQIETQHPDLILLDIGLPTINGYQILEAKSKNAATASIPAIIVSNSDTVFDAQQAATLNVKGYLVKAKLDPNEMAAKVRAVIGESSVPEASAAATAGRLAQRKILWVEDDQFLSSLLAAKLAREGCVAQYAKNGDDALKLAAEVKPDIILLDLLLPGMTGFDVLKALREQPDTAQTPVIVLSNLGQKEDIDKATSLGAAKFLIKAEHDLDDIISEVAKTLQGK